ncbi:hypothetical protein FACS1894133_4300 [Clostridia bacterium]|nr:hypothetical protein FACS1894133_4300 [Clostridia bacterium]
MTEKQWRGIIKFIKAQAKRAENIDDFVKKLDTFAVRSGKLAVRSANDVRGAYRRAVRVVQAAKAESAPRAAAATPPTDPTATTE